MKGYLAMAGFHPQGWGALRLGEAMGMVLQSGRAGLSGSIMLGGCIIVIRFGI